MRVKYFFMIGLFFAIVVYSFPYCMKNYARSRHHEPPFPTANLPIEKKVTIYMNDYQVPFIHADTDHDLAFALGLLHAHYRLPQIELSRIISKGELSLIFGPSTFKIDQTIRILNFGKAAPDIIKQYPPKTRAWMEGYLQGLNYYIEHVSLPWDMKILHLQPKPWTMEDLVTMFRMASSDVNWIYLALFLQNAHRPEAQSVWDFFIRYSEGSLPKVVSGLVGMQESGSNSLVISGKKTKSGAGMIANDPHVNVFLPNLWFLCGFDSPSYHAVGLTIPGVPAIALGRNDSIAWGATNMYSISSFLFELEPDGIKNLQTRTEKIASRFGKDKTISIRDSKYGPVISDSPFFQNSKTLALYWLGHTPSDEMTTFLDVAKAQNWNQFQKSFHSYSIMGLNYLYADRSGNIGYVPAYRQPLTQTNEKNLTYPVSQFSSQTVSESELPRIYNPPQGYIASANNKPMKVERDWGWFYSTDERVSRQGEIVDSTKGKITFEDLSLLQQDTHLSSATHEIVWLDQNTDETVHQNRLFQKLLKWNGNYNHDQVEPLIYEFLMHDMSETLLRKNYIDPNSIERIQQSLFYKKLLFETLKSLSREECSNIVLSSLQLIMSKVSSFRDWGQFHPMTVQYAFGYIPWIGKMFQIDTYPESGATDTLFKRSFLFQKNSAPVTYGSSARHISDLSDPDANYFVLFGAQDGYPFSPDNTNQIGMWREGKYMQIPLRLETVKEKFKTVLALSPQ